MPISRREFIAALSATSAVSAATPGLSLARALSPMDPKADPTVFAHGVASGDPLQDRIVSLDPPDTTQSTGSRHGADAPASFWSGTSADLKGAPFAIERRSDRRGPRLDRKGRRDDGLQARHGLTTIAFDVQGRLRFSRWPGAHPSAKRPTKDCGPRRRFLLATIRPAISTPTAPSPSALERVDAVLHLGDYIYEYANGTFGDGTALGRLVQPPREMVSLEDYRLRHATYKSDPDLQEAHRQHPFITVWDDHESTNDAWRDGAENHQPDTEGDWATRKAASIKAYNEWMPIRSRGTDDARIFRRFRFGDLAEISMLDTRLFGRDQQAANAADIATIDDPARQLLGSEQEAWLTRRLSDSQADGVRWRLIGQQVMMAQLSLDFGRSIANVDQWDGYRPARNRIYQHLRDQRIDNVVVLTGDIHSSWGSDLTPNPFDGSYDPRTGSGALGVEFVTPGITSPFLFPDTPEGAAQAAGAAAQLGSISPHMKYIELFRRGYLLLDVDHTRVQGEWYYPETIKTRNLAEVYGGGLYSAAGNANLRIATAPSATKSNPPDPAP